MQENDQHHTIDTHAHLWPDEYLDELKKLGSQSTDVARNIRATDQDEDLSARFKMMDDAGVRTQILSATPQMPQWGKAEDAAKLAQMINNLYVSLCEKYPGRFSAYGTVPLPHVDQAIAEARRVVQKLGLQGIALNTLIRDEISLANERFLPFFEELNRLNARVYIHATGCGAKSPMVNNFGLEWVVGAPLEDMLCVLHLLKADIPKRFPDIRFHIAHLGGILPFLMQRIEDNYEDWDAFKSDPKESLKNFWFDGANFHEPSLRCSCETFGTDKIFMGSDYPYFQDEKYTRAASYIEDSKLSNKEKLKVLYQNAVSFFDIESS